MLVFLLSMLISFQASAKKWEVEPVEDTPPTCGSWFGVSLPGHWDPEGRDETYVKNLLERKGYISGMDIPCDGNGEGICYGGHTYLDIVGLTHDYNDGKPVRPDELRMSIVHVQWDRLESGALPVQVGVYHHETHKLSYSKKQNRKTLIKMVERLPACKDLRVKHVIHCNGDRRCTRGYYRNDTLRP
jgi:hypothetical protein